MSTTLSLRRNGETFFVKIRMRRLVTTRAEHDFVEGCSPASGGFDRSARSLVARRSEEGEMEIRKTLYVTSAGRMARLAHEALPV